MNAATSRLIRFGVDVSGLRSGHAGVARYLMNMLRELDSREFGFEIRLYSVCPVRLPAFLQDRPIRTGVGIASRSSSFWIQRHLPRQLAEDAVDVFWGQNQLMPIALKHRCFRVLTLHDLAAFVVPNTMPLRSRLTHRLLMRPVMNVADLVVAVSEATFELARRFFQIADKMVVIGEGVGREICIQSAEDAQSRVARILGRADRFVLTVGTIEPRKNHTLLLDALEMLDCPPLLVVVGLPGWKSSRVRARMRALETAGRLRVLGFVSDEDLAALYRAAEVAVYPSLYEGFGLPVLEAMAHGCPMLCSWNSSLPEVGSDAVRYFNSSDASRLACLLAGVLADRDVRQSMAGRGLARAAEFDFRLAAAAFAEAVVSRYRSHSGARHVVT